MTRDEFIDGYCGASESTREAVLARRVALYCCCGEVGCNGWAMIPKDPEAIAFHVERNPVPLEAE